MVRCEPTSLLLLPFTCHWLALAGAPLKEMSAPASKPLFLLSKFPPTATPGIRVVNWMKLRPFSGNWLTCSLSMTLPTSPFSVFKLTAFASTVTVSVAAPISNPRVVVVTVETCTSTSFCDSALNPCFAALIV